MPSRQRLFRLLYRLRFTPWDGHAMSPTLQGLVEGDTALTPGAALDIGCGTGDNAIYLAQHGWQVAGVDYVDKPLAAARKKAAAANVTVKFAKADATKLSTQLASAGVGTGFGLIVDNGCLHGMSDGDREAYVHEVGAVAAPDARLLIIAFVPGGLFGVPGIAPDEVARRFADGWTMLSSGVEDVVGDAAWHYLLARTA